MKAEEHTAKQFHCHWRPADPLIPAVFLKEMQNWWSVLRSMDLHGKDRRYRHATGLSLRAGTNSGFYITGTGAGDSKALDPKQIALVESFDISANRVSCSGPVRVSAGTISHAVIYESLPETRAVILVQHQLYREKLLHQVPTTAEEAGWGTIAQSEEIARLLRDSDAPEKHIIVLGAAPGGILVFGKNLDEAGSYLLAYINSVA